MESCTLIATQAKKSPLEPIISPFESTFTPNLGNSSYRKLLTYLVSDSEFSLVLSVTECKSLSTSSSSSSPEIFTTEELLCFSTLSFLTRFTWNLVLLSCSPSISRTSADPFPTPLDPGREPVDLVVDIFRWSKGRQL